MARINTDDLWITPSTPQTYADMLAAHVAKRDTESISSVGVQVR
jgi:hypothetical protein